MSNVVELFHQDQLRKRLEFMNHLLPTKTLDYNVDSEPCLWTNYKKLYNINE